MNQTNPSVFHEHGDFFTDVFFLHLEDDERSLLLRLSKKVGAFFLEIANQKTRHLKGLIDISVKFFENRSDNHARESLLNIQRQITDQTSLPAIDEQCFQTTRNLGQITDHLNLVERKALMDSICHIQNNQLTQSLVYHLNVPEISCLELKEVMDGVIECCEKGAFYDLKSRLSAVLEKHVSLRSQYEMDAVELYQAVMEMTSEIECVKGTHYCLDAVFFSFPASPLKKFLMAYFLKRDEVENASVFKNSHSERLTALNLAQLRQGGLAMQHLYALINQAFNDLESDSPGNEEKLAKEIKLRDLIWNEAPAVVAQLAANGHFHWVLSFSENLIHCIELLNPSSSLANSVICKLCEPAGSFKDRIYTAVASNSSCCLAISILDRIKDVGVRLSIIRSLISTSKEAESIALCMQYLSQYSSGLGCVSATLIACKYFEEALSLLERGVSPDHFDGILEHELIDLIRYTCRKEQPERGLNVIKKLGWRGEMLGEKLALPLATAFAKKGDHIQAQAVCDGIAAPAMKILIKSTIERLAVNVKR